jgi:hypothetical protein
MIILQRTFHQLWSLNFYCDLNPRRHNSIQMELWGDECLLSALDLKKVICEATATASGVECRGAKLPFLAPQDR